MVGILKATAVEKLYIENLCFERGQIVDPLSTGKFMRKNVKYFPHSNEFVILWF